MVNKAKGFPATVCGTDIPTTYMFGTCIFVTSMLMQVFLGFSDPEEINIPDGLIHGFITFIIISSYLLFQHERPCVSTLLLNYTATTANTLRMHR